MTRAADDDYIVDWAEKVAGMAETARDDRHWYAALARDLVRSGDRTAVDVGCGGGGMTLALAAALPAGGRVFALDATTQMLETVAAQVDAATDLRASVELVRADLGDGLGSAASALAGAADLVWASASVHHAGDQQAAVDALAALLAGGGRLTLAEGGLSARYLPWDVGVGEPGLELRLEAAHDRWYARMRAELPGSRRMPYGWTEALRRAGLTEIHTRSTLRESPTPLPAADRELVLDRLGHMVDKLRPTGLLAPEDLAVWTRLLDPDDPAWLGHRGDLQRLDVRSLHLGTKPA